MRGREIADGNREERERAYHEAGSALRRVGACDRAVGLLDRAADCMPGCIEVITDGAMARIDAGDYGGAEVWLERALGISGGERPAVVVSGRQAIEALLALVREACPHPALERLLEVAAKRPSPFLSPQAQPKRRDGKTPQHQRTSTP